MSRERFIAPEIWKSEQVNRCSIEAALLFIGCFSTADDEGRRKASPYSLKIDVFPDRAVTLEEVAAWRDELAREGVIRLYRDDDGELLMDMPKFHKYQHLKYTRNSIYAAYPGQGAVEPDSAGSGQDRPEPARSSQDRPEPAGTGQNPPESATGCGVEGSGATKPAVRCSTGSALEESEPRAGPSGNGGLAHVRSGGNINGEPAREERMTPERRLLREITLSWHPPPTSLQQRRLESAFAGKPMIVLAHAWAIARALEAGRVTVPWSCLLKRLDGAKHMPADSDTAWVKARLAEDGAKRGGEVGKLSDSLAAAMADGKVSMSQA